VCTLRQLSASTIVFCSLVHASDELIAMIFKTHCTIANCCYSLMHDALSALLLLQALELYQKKGLKKAVQYLVASNFISDTPRDIANFLR
jgi:hypothetical protein